MIKLNLSMIEFLLRAIPEGFIVIFGVYAFSKTRVVKKNLLIAGSILALSLYLIRAIPISYGIHTILGILVIS
ncbi:MAG: hypothetical protein ACRCW2_14990, partial [Cellulosilyticaceae bacterium]